jgi:hypothetical protein
MYKKCKACGKPIVLVPSAKERAEKFGGKPSAYTRLFTVHAQCAVEKYNQDTSRLIRMGSE